MVLHLLRGRREDADLLDALSLVYVGADEGRQLPLDLFERAGDNHGLDYLYLLQRTFLLVRSNLMYRR